jgi:hypothetical protein
MKSITRGIEEIEYIVDAILEEFTIVRAAADTEQAKQLLLTSMNLQKANEMLDGQQKRIAELESKLKLADRNNELLRGHRDIQAERIKGLEAALAHANLHGEKLYENNKELEAEVARLQNQSMGTMDDKILKQQSKMIDALSIGWNEPTVQSSVQSPEPDWGPSWEKVNMELLDRGGVNPHAYRLGYLDAAARLKSPSLVNELSGTIAMLLHHVPNTPDFDHIRDKAKAAIAKASKEEL